MLRKPMLLNKKGTGFEMGTDDPFRLKPVKGGYIAESWFEDDIWYWNEYVEDLILKDYDTFYQKPEKVQAFIDSKRTEKPVTEDEKELLKLALKIATEAHKGQKDKGGNDYILHPVAVAEKIKNPYWKAIALLHDVIEDGGETVESLKAKGLPDGVVENVWKLSKKEGEAKSVYLLNIALSVPARIVKLADLEHNCDLSRIPHPTEKDIARTEDYKKQIEFIENYGYEKVPESETEKMQSQPRLFDHGGTGFFAISGQPFRLKPVKDGFVAEVWSNGYEWYWDKEAEGNIELGYDTVYCSAEKVREYIHSHAKYDPISDGMQAYYEKAMHLANDLRNKRSVVDEKGFLIRRLNPTIPNISRNEELNVLAFLYDMVVESGVTIKYLEEKGLPDWFIRDIRRLTRHNGETEENYLLKIARDSSTRYVKIAQLKRQLQFLENYGYEPEQTSEKPCEM